MLKIMQSLTSNPKLKKIMAICMCMLVGCSMLSVLGFAADETAADMTANEAATTIMNEIMKQINVGAVVGVIAIGIGAGIALYFAWFAIRKVGRGVRKGLNGKSPF